MQRINEIPKTPRFQFATQKAYELLADLEISKFPVDPEKIIESFPNWNLLKWTELQENTDVNDPRNLDRDKVEAKTEKIRGRNDYLIVYDDRVSDPRRIRWTLAHEIGHIVLNHLEEFEKTALNRRGLTKDEYGILEVEAHWFAANLLAPKTLLRRFNFEDKAQAISLICDISKEAAEKRLNEVTRASSDFYPTENRILRNFYKQLFSGDFYNAMSNAAYKFIGTSYYPNMYKECRICPSCLNFIVDENYIYCHSCGAAAPSPENYSPFNILFNDTLSQDTPPQEGKNPYRIPYDKGRAAFCPVCKNAISLKEKETCGGCGTTLVNRCTSENKELSHAYKYCTDCGAKTTFYDIYEKLPKRLSADNINIPIELDDYIEYDYWSFVVMTVGYWEINKTLFAAIEDSVAFYDYENMIIFVRDEEAASTVNQSTKCILKCLSQYAEAPITKVSVAVATLI